MLGRSPQGVGVEMSPQCVVEAEHCPRRAAVAGCRRTQGAGCRMIRKAVVERLGCYATEVACCHWWAVVGSHTCHWGAVCRASHLVAACLGRCPREVGAYRSCQGGEGCCRSCRWEEGACCRRRPQVGEGSCRRCRWEVGACCHSRPQVGEGCCRWAEEAAAHHSLQREEGPAAAAAAVYASQNGEAACSGIGQWTSVVLMQAVLWFLKGCTSDTAGWWRKSHRISLRYQTNWGWRTHA